MDFSTSAYRGKEIKKQKDGYSYGSYSELSYTEVRNIIDDEFDEAALEQDKFVAYFFANPSQQRLDELLKMVEIE